MLLVFGASMLLESKILLTLIEGITNKSYLVLIKTCCHRSKQVQPHKSVCDKTATV